MSLDPTAFLADPELIRVLSKHATSFVCEADRMLFRQSDPAVGLYILHVGEAELSMTSPSGQPILKADAKAGSLLGLPGVICDQPYSLTALARAGAQVSFLGRAEFTAIMESNQVLALQILQVLAAEVRAARKALF